MVNASYVAMLKASYVAEVALQGKYIGTPYSKLDCQALMEQLLTDVGVTHPNWRGSNHMWREALSSKGTVEAMKAICGGELPAGAWLFTVKNDGGEVERGYHDTEGNAAHVGMYLGNGKVIHSTTGGVQWDVITSSRWTHAGLCNLLDYSNDSYPTTDTKAEVEKAFSQLKGALEKYGFTV